eukprot:8488827-Alexandrium_andersonii.AAC.1
MKISRMLLRWLCLCVVYGGLGMYSSSARPALVVHHGNALTLSTRVVRSVLAMNRSSLTTMTCVGSCGSGSNVLHAIVMLSALRYSWSGLGTVHTGASRV